ncbi:MAG: hypothetical protein ACJA0V_003368 [Planctomycetota bacterium]|jgi:hypothetical protein
MLRQHSGDQFRVGAWLNGSSLSAELCTFQGGPGLAIGPFGLTTDAGDGLMIAASQIGPLLVDLQTAGLIFGILDGAGQFSFPVPTMVLAPVFGLPIHAQAGTFDAGLGLLRTSNGNIERFSL